MNRPKAMSKTQDIRNIPFQELKEELESWGEKPFRAKQIWEWLWAKQAKSFEEMTNLSKGLRQKLEETYAFHTATAKIGQSSNDGSVKYGFQLADGHYIEGVLIPAGDRVTACVSSQVGCSLGCKFCATGYMNLTRSLAHYEIFDQVARLNEESRRLFDRPLSNIVYMGMGEPLLNYKQVKQSIERITAPDGMGFSPHRITVSSVGLAKMIRKLGDDQIKYEFALSLHAATDDKRNQIMPINQTNDLASLKEALQYFYQQTHKRITLEYIVFQDFNDSMEDAKALANFARIIPTKINIIEYNPIAETLLRNTTEDRMQDFIAYLESQKLIVNVRRSRGKDVDGGCGQLANKQHTKAAPLQ
jgi:23S rRNA (adenine2503-C2)-methyltransferase